MADVDEIKSLSIESDVKKEPLAVVQVEELKCTIPASQDAATDFHQLSW
jgi:hypothetical protein